MKALCLYFRPYNEAGYFGNDDIYYTVYLRERTVEHLVSQICHKSAIDETRVKEIVYLKFDKIVGAMNDQIIRGLSDEQPFDVELVPVYHDSQDNIDITESLQMRLHL